jgi:hypothetical protein
MLFLSIFGALIAFYIIKTIIEKGWDSWAGRFVSDLSTIAKLTIYLSMLVIILLALINGAVWLSILIGVIISIAMIVFFSILIYTLFIQKD